MQPQVPQQLWLARTPPQQARLPQLQKLRQPQLQPLHLSHQPITLKTGL
jgi:hypothetical protein